MKTIRYIDFGIFPGRIMFVYKFKHNEVLKFLNKHKATNWSIGIEDDQELIDNPYPCALRRDISNKETKEERTLFYIFIKSEFLFLDHDYCVLAHEVLHICQFFLKDILKRDKEHEAEAYLHTHIMESCLKALRDCQPKKHPKIKNSNPRKKRDKSAIKRKKSTFQPS